MVKQDSRVSTETVVAILCVVAVLLDACVGSGSGLDAGGNPIGSSSAPSSSAPAGLTADFQSIQDNIFTPICTRCHSGAGAPEGLQLDAAHSYALLVGVPSAEVPGTLRVKAGDPDDSYIIQKLQGSSGIVGAQMPFGGPYLPQATINVIRQWITAGAPPATSAITATALSVKATVPLDQTSMLAPVTSITVALTQEPDPSQLGRAIQVLKLDDHTHDVPIRIDQAEGNPATLLVRPLTPLVPGAYRVLLHGGDAAALTTRAGNSLPAAYSFTFTVDEP